MTSRPERDPGLYKVLALEFGAPLEVVKKSFKVLALKYHPDKNRTEISGDATSSCSSIGDCASTTERFKEISEAYQILGNAERKAKYDTTFDPKGMEAFYATVATNGLAAAMKGERRGQQGAFSRMHNATDRYGAVSAAEAAEKELEKLRAGNKFRQTPKKPVNTNGPQPSDKYTPEQQELFRQKERERAKAVKRKIEQEKEEENNRKLEAIRKAQQESERRYTQLSDSDPSPLTPSIGAAYSTITRVGGTSRAPPPVTNLSTMADQTLSSPVELSRSSSFTNLPTVGHPNLSTTPVRSTGLRDKIGSSHSHMHRSRTAGWDDDSTPKELQSPPPSAKVHAVANPQSVTPNRSTNRFQIHPGTPVATVVKVAGPATSKPGTSASSAPASRTHSPTPANDVIKGTSVNFRRPDEARAKTDADRSIITNNLVNIQEPAAREGIAATMEPFERMCTLSAMQREGTILVTRMALADVSLVTEPTVRRQIEATQVMVRNGLTLEFASLRQRLLVAQQEVDARARLIKSYYRHSQQVREIRRSMDALMATCVAGKWQLACRYGHLSADYIYMQETMHRGLIAKVAFHVFASSVSQANAEATLTDPRDIFTAKASVADTEAAERAVLIVLEEEAAARARIMSSYRTSIEGGLDYYHHDVWVPVDECDSDVDSLDDYIHLTSPQRRRCGYNSRLKVPQPLIAASGFQDIWDHGRRANSPSFSPIRSKSTFISGAHSSAPSPSGRFIPFFAKSSNTSIGQSQLFPCPKPAKMVIGLQRQKDELNKVLFALLLSNMQIIMARHKQLAEENCALKVENAALKSQHQCVSSNIAASAVGPPPLEIDSATAFKVADSEQDELGQRTPPSNVSLLVTPTDLAIELPTAAIPKSPAFTFRIRPPAEYMSISSPRAVSEGPDTNKGAVECEKMTPSKGHTILDRLLKSASPSATSPAAAAVLRRARSADPPTTPQKAKVDVLTTLTMARGRKGDDFEELPTQRAAGRLNNPVVASRSASSSSVVPPVPMTYVAAKAIASATTTPRGATAMHRHNEAPTAFQRAATATATTAPKRLGRGTEPSAVMALRVSVFPPGQSAIGSQRPPHGASK